MSWCRISNYYKKYRYVNEINKTYCEFFYIKTLIFWGLKPSRGTNEPRKSLAARWRYIKTFHAGKNRAIHFVMTLRTSFSRLLSLHVISISPLFVLQPQCWGSFNDTNGDGCLFLPPTLASLLLYLYTSIWCLSSLQTLLQCPSVTNTSGK